jgi:uncharacterized membrane protein
MKNSLERFFFDFLNRCKSIFMHGFFILLPLAITFAVIRLIFRLIKSTLLPIYNLEPSVLKQIPHSEVIIAIVVTFILGILADLFLIKFIYKLENSILNKIPLFRQVYFGAKQLVTALNPKDKLTFKTVVIIEYPRTGVYSIGFITNEILPEHFPSLSGKHYSVFIPSVPNPATGHYLIAPEKDCTIITISRQEALALIISGGIIQPDTVQKSE